MSQKGDTTKVVRKLRCAVYTRKSSEEGLEQEFNSLDAQREACEVLSTMGTSCHTVSSLRNLPSSNTTASFTICNAKVPPTTFHLKLWIGPAIRLVILS